jgi:hypothetical protein
VVRRTIRKQLESHSVTIGFKPQASKIKKDKKGKEEEKEEV